MLESLGQIFHLADVVDELPEHLCCKKAINNLSENKYLLSTLGMCTWFFIIIKTFNEINLPFFSYSAFFFIVSQLILPTKFTTVGASSINLSIYQQVLEFTQQRLWLKEYYTKIIIQMWYTLFKMSTLPPQPFSFFWQN